MRRLTPYFVSTADPGGAAGDLCDGVKTLNRKTCFLLTSAISLCGFRTDSGGAASLASEHVRDGNLHEIS